MTCFHIKSGTRCKICDPPEEKKKPKPIRKISDRRKKEKPEYDKARKEYMNDHPFCEMPECNKESIECHHKKGRAKYYTDKTFFMALCFDCHKMVHRNPKESFKNGWMILRSN